jgi:polyphosphate kinase 2 (PPK2 family)
MLATANSQARNTAPNLIAIWDGTDAGGTGGTAHMITEAKQQDATIKVIDPLVSDR